MELLGVIQEDFINYKKPSMLLEFPFCTFKCNKEFGSSICQNWELSNYSIRYYDIKTVINCYINNSLTEAVIFQGLEPFDSFQDVYEFISEFRKISKDDIVIYTGYTEFEIEDKVNLLKNFNNIIIKYGRYVPGMDPHFDKVLQVNLSSDNQYAVKIS